MSRSVDLLKKLVAIPSINPMGRDLTGPEYLETRLSDFLELYFKQLQVQYERFEVRPGRHNVVARFNSPGATRTIMLDAHQDTVPVDGMTIPPFDPVISDGKLYGRGSCDVKGGMAAMLAAFERLVQEKPAGAANVIMSCTCDEEATALGIDHLVQTWIHSRSTIATRPDLVIVAEPTNLDVVVAHRGVARWKIFTKGVACHSSRPDQGINAIYRMAKVLNAFEEYAIELPKKIAPHHLCGDATLSVGLIQGGISVNTVPDQCEIQIDRRLLPGETGQAAIDDVMAFLKNKLDFEAIFEPTFLICLAMPDDLNGPLSDELLNTIASVVGPHQKIGVPYGTNSPPIVADGVPTVVFGPGDIAKAHSKDEWITIEQLDQASEIYYRFCVGK
jgi:succinyl-diaminopimelate desuccinylase